MWVPEVYFEDNEMFADIRGETNTTRAGSSRGSQERELVHTDAMLIHHR